MAGAFYLWIMLGFFTCAALAILGFTFLLYLGHRLEKKQTGSTHRFLELPPNPTPPTTAPQNSDPPPEK